MRSPERKPTFNSSEIGRQSELSSHSSLAPSGSSGRDNCRLYIFFLAGFLWLLANEQLLTKSSHETFAKLDNDMCSSPTPSLSLSIVLLFTESHTGSSLIRGTPEMITTQPPKAIQL